MNSQGDPQIRKIGKDYYIKAEDMLLIFDFFADDALETLSEQDDDEVTEFDFGLFEGAAEVLDDLSKTLKLMITEKRLNKIKNLEDFTKEFPETKFQRNREIKIEQHCPRFDKDVRQWYNRYISKGQQCPANLIGEIQMAKSLKAGDLYTTSVSGINGVIANITASRGRKVVELVTLEGNVFSTVPRGVRAKVSA